ncbi:MAG TPA: TonB-dependent receptor [Nevskiaceae bacterium]|nr:TonB-dependent receptor [Nevskiaceae bacterium]
MLLWLALQSGASAAQESTPQSNDPLPAQDPPAEPKKDDASTKLEKVVVTANKREQLLTDVPMAVSAISGKDLEKNGERTFADYAQKIPALNFGYYGEGRQRISIRGLQAPTGVSTVAYLVDGIEQGDSPPDPDLFDIDHIEVLRGPQGTLYGAGAVGGAIKILTNRANPYAFQTKFLGSAGYNVAGAWQHDVNAMANVPLIPGELGARVVGFQRSADGYITVREPDFNNPPSTPAYRFKSYSSRNIVASDANTTAVRGGRLAVDWKAGNDLTIGAKYMTESSKIKYGPMQSVDLDERYGGYNVVQGCACALSDDITDHDYAQTTFNVDWNWGFAKFESVTGIAEVKEDIGSPLFIVLPAVDTALAIAGQTPPITIPALPDPIRQILLDAGLPTEAAVGDMFDFRLINRHNYTSQEFRLVSAPTDFPLTWTAGLFYKLENREAFEDVYSGPNLGPILGGNDGTPYEQVNLHFRTEEYAAYGQLEYAITQKLSALAGVRYYRANLEDTAVGGGTDGSVFTPRFKDVSPKFTLSYHVTDSALAYATAAKGFRIGGVNFSTIDPPPPNLTRYYEPDVLWNYEVGMNTLIFDGRLSANFALFDCQWKNLQDEIVVRSNPTVDAQGNFHPGGNERMVINAGRAYSRGVEAELSASLPLDLTWTLSGAYLDAAIGQDQANPANGGVIPKGTRLENVPRFAGNTSLTHELRFGNGWGLASSVNYTYRGRTHADITNPTEARSPAYHLVDLRMGVHGQNQRWSVDAFANNVLNARASSFTFQNSGTPYTLPFHTDVPLAYRTVGLRANVTF